MDESLKQILEEVLNVRDVRVVEQMLNEIIIKDGAARRRKLEAIIMEVVE